MVFFCFLYLQHCEQSMMMFWSKQYLQNLFGFQTGFVVNVDTYKYKLSQRAVDTLKALMFLYAFEESVDCHLLSSFCDDSNLHISLFKYVLSTMGVSKESVSKFLIGNRFHVKLRILSPYSKRIAYTHRGKYILERAVEYEMNFWSTVQMKRRLCFSLSDNGPLPGLLTSERTKSLEVLVGRRTSFAQWNCKLEVDYFVQWKADFEGRWMWGCL